MRTCAVIAALCCLVSALGAPHSEWQLSFAHPSSGKYEDFAVAGKSQAWVVSAVGEVLHTADAGATWAVQASNLGRLRSIDFIDSLRGFAGTLTGVLYRTNDGGVTWKDMTSELPRPAQGFCGITHVGERVHAVGRYYGNVTDHFVSPDGGKTWKAQDLRSMAQGLVEVSFINEKVGFIGGMASSGATNNGPAIILQTKDAGETWHPVFTHDGGRGFAWKIFPVTNRIIYASLQSQDGIYRVAKSTDAGDSWIVMTVATGQPMGPAVQAVGFLDEYHGFVGGFFNGLWETIDGGKTWAKIELGSASRVVNRFELIGSTLTTAAGQGIWAYR